jgi:uncharacterized protein YprB with RNaseH-like and TPR domain
MSKLKDKLNYLGKNQVKQNWQQLDADDGLSTRDKLEKLVNMSLKRDKTIRPKKKSLPNEDLLSPEERQSAFIIRDFNYPLANMYGQFALSEWKTVTTHQLTVIFGEENCEEEDIDPTQLLFFDTETTGLSGGAGTIPFMLGFGYFDMDHDSFNVRIFILNNLSREDAFLEEVDHFLASREFSATVTYNGKTFDFPLMESRYILQRKRFSLLTLPHLDFLFPARVIWRHTYESRKLGYLGEELLGLSREGDIDGSQIPATYFNYLRSKAFTLIRKVVEHNALDLVGLAALLLLGIKYQEDIAFTTDPGEILGTAMLCEKFGDSQKAMTLYRQLQEINAPDEIVSKAVKGMAIINKKQKLYNDASKLWELLTQIQGDDHHAIRELSIHLEHREKDYEKALHHVKNALDTIDLTHPQRQDFEKRLERLTRKRTALEKEEQKYLDKKR